MTHRAAGEAGRGRPGRLLAALVAAALTVTVTIGVVAARRHLADDRRAAGCPEGLAVIQVAAAPDIAPLVQHLADEYNSGNPVVHDHCAEVRVGAHPSEETAAALARTGESTAWDVAASGPPPALWIPQSSRWVARLRPPGLIAGNPVSVASSPIVLALPAELRSALTTHKVGWAQLPALQNGTLAAVGLPGWGGLGMAMPATDAALAATNAVAEAVAGLSPLPDSVAGSEPVTAAVRTLAAGAPLGGEADPQLTIAAQSAPAAAQLHAVAATQREVKANEQLAAYQPAGPQPVADYPAALISGPWVDDTRTRVAVLFTEFLVAHRSTFVSGGYAAPVAPQALPSAETLDRLADLVAHPPGVVTSVLIDNTSAMATADGAETRLNRVLAALRTRLDAVPENSGVGVWLTGADPGAPDSYRAVAPTAPLTAAQRGRVDAALHTSEPLPSPASHCYPALLTAYRNAIAGYGANRTNSVLLVTAGPNDNSPVTGRQLLSAAADAADPARPVHIDVLVIGDADSATLRTLANDTGGAYTRLPRSDSPDLPRILTHALHGR